MDKTPYQLAVELLEKLIEPVRDYQSITAAIDFVADAKAKMGAKK